MENVVAALLRRRDLGGGYQRTRKGGEEDSRDQPPSHKVRHGVRRKEKIDRDRGRQKPKGKRQMG